MPPEMGELSPAVAKLREELSLLPRSPLDSMAASSEMVESSKMVICRLNSREAGEGGEGGGFDVVNSGKLRREERTSCGGRFPSYPHTRHKRVEAAQGRTSTCMTMRALAGRIT